MIIPPMVANFFHGDRQTERQTNRTVRHDELIVTFCNFTKVSNKSHFSSDFLMVFFCMYHIISIKY